MVDAESQAAWEPILRSALERNPALNAPCARCIKDEHKGSAAAQSVVMTNAAPFSCAFHLRGHVTTDVSFGKGEERQKAGVVHDICVRAPNSDTVKSTLAAHLAAGNTTSYYKITRNLPLEQ